MKKSTYTAAAKIWLTRNEESLRHDLDHGEMPFIGLYADKFPAKTRQYFRDEILDVARPVQSFVRGLALWPATFASYLTVHIVEGYGRSGTCEVYPFIQEAFGLCQRPITNSQREELWQAFRRACVTLGLAVLPANGARRAMVDEYLQQAGVPLRYLSKLFRKFATLATEFGLPQEDDPEGQQIWQSKVSLTYLPTPVQTAIRNDQGAYYTRLFRCINLMKSEEECSSAIELAAFRALSQIGNVATSKRSLIPELRWQAGHLGFAMPADETRTWSVRVDDFNEQTIVLPTLVGEKETRFVPLPDCNPSSIHLSSSNVEFKLDVWPSGRDNSFLLFAHSGRSAGRGQLGGSNVEVNPGTYTGLFRWRPPEFSEAAYECSAEANFYVVEFEVRAGSEVTLTRGPATVAVVGRSVPAMEWSGERLVGMTGREVYASAGLKVRVSIPQEFLAAARAGFQIGLRVDENEARQIDIDPEDSAVLEIHLSLALGNCEPGLRRVVLSLRRPDIPNRSLARASAYVWIGLVAVAGNRFRCSSPRALSNLNREQSENIVVKECEVTYADDAQRFFRTVFNVPERQQVAFKWPVPGIFLNLESYSDGRLVERPLKLGSVIQIRHGSRQRLQIYSSYSGELVIGTYSRLIDGTTYGGAAVYLSSLIEHLTPEERTLSLLLQESRVAKPLVRFVSPHEAFHFAITRTSDTCVFGFKTAGNLQAIVLKAVEIVSGETKDVVVEADTTPISGDPMAQISVSTSPVANGTAAAVRIPLMELKEGAWILGLEAKIDGRWGQLVNGRGDVFAGAAIVATTADKISRRLKESSVEAQLEVFQRLNGRLLECYAEESWQGMAWLAELWDVIAEELEVCAGDHLQRLIALSLKNPPETASDSWVPIKLVIARLLTLFSQPIDDYRNIASANNVISGLWGGEALSKEGVGPYEDLVLSSFLPFAFGNASGFLNRQAPYLLSFSIEQYRDLYNYAGENERRRIHHSVDWAPAAGDFLGPQHYWWATARMREHYRLTSEGNDFRKGRGLRLASRISSSGLSTVGLEEAVNHLADQLSLGLLDGMRDLESDLDQETENVENLINLISVLAYSCRLDCRRPGSLGRTRAALAAIIDADDRELNGILAYVLFIGIDVFIFYLSLWEYVQLRDCGGQ